MTGYTIVGTDTDAGKTAFSAWFLASNADRFAYWKPVETGDSDTATIRRLVPHATVFDPLARFAEPVAPMLAARREGRSMPGIEEILAAVPVLGGTGFQPVQHLLIETFGGPLSPLADGVLQLELIRALGLPVILVASSSVGAVGRTLAAARALEEVELAAIALMGPEDPFAIEQLNRHLPGVSILSGPMPTAWTPDAFAACPIDWHPREELLREFFRVRMRGPGEEHVIEPPRGVADGPHDRRLAVPVQDRPPR